MADKLNETVKEAAQALILKVGFTEEAEFRRGQQALELLENFLLMADSPAPRWGGRPELQAGYSAAAVAGEWLHGPAKKLISDEGKS